MDTKRPLPADVLKYTKAIGARSRFFFFFFETKKAQGPLHKRTQKYNPTQAAGTRPTEASQEKERKPD
jgi:hypothetical protein